MNIGSCSLHKVHNAFGKGLSCLKIDSDQFSCDIYLFNSRREDYASLKEVTEVASAHAIKHRQGGFHSKKLVIKLLNCETTCFNIFNREIKGTICYQRIKQYLKSELTSYLACVSFIAPNVEAFVIFRSTEPLIHLYEKRTYLLTNIMTKFIKIF